MAEGPATKRVLGRVRREAKRWLPPGGHLVVALSGGGDSMALWFVLHRLAPEFGWRLYPVHVDHRLRPESSHQAAWLKAWMRERFAASLTVVSVTVAPHAGESLEQAARRVRHAALEGERRRLPSPSAVAFGHQRDDQAETVLMRVLTGTGVEGLAAIRNREGRLYPLLGCAREELRQLLREQGLPWIEDPTNRDPRWLRNRLRQQVLPFLEQTTNPRVAAALAGLAERAAEVMDYLEGEVDTWMASGVAAEADGFVVAAAFAELHPALQAVVINRLGRLVGLRLSARQVQQARRRNTDLGGGWRVEHRPDGGLRWRRAAPLRPPATAPRLLSEGVQPWAGGRLACRRANGGDGWPRGWLAIDAQAWPTLWVRGWLPGDRVQPLGMAGHRKLKRVFQERKLPPGWRRKWPVVVAGPEATSPVLGVPGLVTSELARVTGGRPVHLVAFFPDPAWGEVPPGVATPEPW